MSLATRITDLATRVGAEFKTVRSQMVATTGDQTVGGNKTFSERITTAKQVRGTDFELSNPTGSYSVNAYWDGANWRYITGGRAFLMQHNTTTGALDYRVAVLGTAGAVISWLDRASIGEGGVKDAGQRVYSPANPPPASGGGISPDPSEPIDADDILVADTSPGTPVWQSVHPADAGIMTTYRDQIVSSTGIKRFPPGTLLMRNAAGTAHAEPYSDVNPPESMLLTEYFGGPPPAPAAGLATMYTTDGKSLRMRDNDGTDTLIGPAAGGGASPVTVYELTTDRAFTTTAYADIPDWIVPLPANTTVTLDGILVFQSAALTTGFGFSAITRTAAGATLAPARFLLTFEYQTSATAWATFTQTVHTSPMAVTTASYVANAGILCRITGQVELGATPGNLHFQARSEIAGSAITLRRGSPLRVM